jgi:hypothetical protein
MKSLLVQVEEIAVVVVNVVEAVSVVTVVDETSFGGD